MEDFSQYAKLFAALLAIVNPIGAVPLFVTLTGQQTAVERRRTAFTAAVTVGTVLVVSLLVGEAILRFFGISIASFRVAGGILVLLIAVSMMYARTSPARHTPEEAAEAFDKASVAVVPIGVPLLAGPGAISTVIVYAHRLASPAQYGAILIVIGVVTLSVWLAFRTAPYVAKLLGRTGINVVTRIMGLIIGAIGVEFIANGLKQLLPGLA